MANKNRIFMSEVGFKIQGVDDFLVETDPLITQEELDSRCPRCVGLKVIVISGTIKQCPSCSGSGKYQDCDLGI